jgi:hypothetical protein
MDETDSVSWSVAGYALAALKFCCTNRKYASVARHFSLNILSSTTFLIHQSRICYSTHSTLSMYAYKATVQHHVNKIVLPQESLKLKLNSMVWVRERTTPTERPQFVGEVIANYCG